MEHKTCPRCGCGFWADEPWKRICLDCWLEERYPGRRQKRQQTRSEGEDFSRNSNANRAGSIPDEMLRRLIQLCHPDKHGGSEAATKATTFLLQLKAQR